MSFHISKKTGEPAHCSAKPGNCPLGGGESEHFESKAEARAFAESKLAEQHGAMAKASNKVDFSKVEPMEKQDDGSYSIEAGEYYVISSEGWEDVKELNNEAKAAYDLIVSSGVNTDDKRTDTAIGVRVDGEPLYSIKEKWSGVTNSFVTPKTYKTLMGKLKTLALLENDEPSTVVFNKDTTLGRTGLLDSDDYGSIYIGGEPHDLFQGENSIVMPGKTVIN